MRNDEQAQIQAVIDRLVRRHPQVRTEAVVQVVEDALADFAHATVRDFVPLLVARRASRELARRGAG